MNFENVNPLNLVEKEYSDYVEFLKQNIKTLPLNEFWGWVFSDVEVSEIEKELKKEKIIQVALIYKANELKIRIFDKNRNHLRPITRMLSVLNQ